METYDFCGWATKNDLRCSDGRIIRHNAFKGNDGEKVPLVWSHDHDDPDKVLGPVSYTHLDVYKRQIPDFSSHFSGRVAIQFPTVGKRENHGIARFT